MAIPPIFKISRKTFFNPSGWLNAEALVDLNKFIVDTLRSTLFTPERPIRTETFDEAMKRQGVTPAEVRQMVQRYNLWSWLFVACGLVAFLYGFFLLFQSFAITAWLLNMAVSCLFLTQAFRFSFYRLQLKKRKLGLSFAEWRESILGDGKPHHD